ncbi:MAG: creatininase family protein [Candidatus Omnitrophica bacterium]|nr:creatininase family protein [Candidatus Omnitrophota bacterium]
MEVRYERLRPNEVKNQRKSCPVAYIPLGTLEWHGPHNPVGLDSIKIHKICIRCAEEGGGLVFPPLYYGEAREEGLMDSNPLHVGAISKEMELPTENFELGYMRESPSEAFQNYQRLLLHILNQAQSLGFRVLVLAAGHYPLIDHARAAASIFHQQRRFGSDYGRPKAIPWVFTGYELVRDLYPDAGDHAGFWETSLLMALEPDLVDLSRLPEDESTVPGVISNRPIKESNREFGEEAVGNIVERALAQVQDRLDHPDKYRGHGLKF